MTAIRNPTTSSSATFCSKLLGAPATLRALAPALAWMLLAGFSFCLSGCSALGEPGSEANASTAAREGDDTIVLVLDGLAAVQGKRIGSICNAIAIISHTCTTKCSSVTSISNICSIICNACITNDKAIPDWLSRHEVHVKCKGQFDSKEEMAFYGVKFLGHDSAIDKMSADKQQDTALKHISECCNMQLVQRQCLARTPRIRLSKPA